MNSSARAGGTMAAVLLIGGAAAVVSTSYAMASPDGVRAELTSDSLQSTVVKSRFTEAMTVRQIMTVPNHGAGQVGLLSKRTLDEQIDSGTKALGKVFTPAAAEQEMTGLRNSVSSETNGNTEEQGAGVSNVTFDQVSITGKMANVHAHVTTWSKFKLRQNAQSAWISAHPSNVLDVQAILSRDATGTWKVSTLDWDFAPGSEP